MADHGMDNNWSYEVIHDHLVLKWFHTTCLASKYMNTLTHSTIKLMSITATGECSGCKTAKWWNWKLVICKISNANMTDVASEVHWINKIPIEGCTLFVFTVYLTILSVTRLWLVRLTLWPYRERQQGNSFSEMLVPMFLSRYMLSHPRYSWFNLLDLFSSNGSKTFVNKLFLCELWVILFILISSSLWILMPLMTPAFQNLKHNKHVVSVKFPNLLNCSVPLLRGVTFRADPVSSYTLSPAMPPLLGIFFNPSGMTFRAAIILL
jgi:hypothetical protein